MKNQADYSQYRCPFSFVAEELPLILSYLMIGQNEYGQSLLREPETDTCELCQNDFHADELIPIIHEAGSFLVCEACFISDELNGYISAKGFTK